MVTQASGDPTWEPATGQEDRQQGIRLGIANIVCPLACAKGSLAVQRRVRRRPVLNAIFGLPRGRHCEDHPDSSRRRGLRSCPWPDSDCVPNQGRTWPARTVRPWPLLVLALPTSVAVWSGWVGIGQTTGFGVVRSLPGIVTSLRIDTAITLPLGVESYAAYALRAWLAADQSERPRSFRTGDPIGFSPERDGIKCRESRKTTLLNLRSKLLRG